MRKLPVILIFLFLHVISRAAYLIDDCETGTLTNTTGGAWITYTDGYSTLTFTPNDAPGYAGAYCRKLGWDLSSGNASGSYAGAACGINSGWTAVDLHTYAGVRFWAYGTAGIVAVQVGTDQTRTLGNHYSATVAITPSWRLIEVPFSSLGPPTWGGSPSWDPTTVFSVGFVTLSSAGNSGYLRVDNLEFYTAAEATAPSDPNIIIPLPKVNQEGYLPGGNKYFCVVTNTASAGDPYYILDAIGNTVYTGSVAGPAFDDRPSTGEGVLRTDFSSFTTPGTYTLRVNSQPSCPFIINDNVFDSLFKDALRSFYLIRCGPAVNDPVTGINRPACHMSDGLIRGSAGSGDFTGGWHNAQDFGKYTNETAISISYMLWLYEFKPSHMSGIYNNIPESGNGTSDLLNEAKWGLNWLFKMQRADGAVYHKVDSEPNLFDCVAPSADPNLRYAEFQQATSSQVPSTIDAADLAAVMAQAARVFGGVDPAYSAQCMAAAQKSWSWALANTSTAQSDPYYLDTAQWQEYMWAEAEMGRELNSQPLRDSFSLMTDSNAVTPVGWNDPQLFGYLALFEDPNSPQALKDKLRSKVQSMCDSFLNNVSISGYSSVMQSFEYWWESNETLMHRACGMLFGYEMSGNAAYRDGALKQLNYMLGLNSLNRSFVMSHGCNPMQKPWNALYLVYGKSIPAWCAGGPNQYVTGADPLLVSVINSGAPKAKCYIDEGICGAGSWADNEGETSEEAALVFLSGYFYSVTYANTPTQTATICTKTATPSITGTLTRTPTFTATATTTCTRAFTATQTPAPTWTPTPHPENGDIYAYPAVCDMRKGDAGFTFSNLPAGAELFIYNISGELIFDAVISPPGGKYFWKLSGSRMRNRIVPGFYIYMAACNGKILKKGKIALIR